jgi:hypothetical protein
VIGGSCFLGLVGGFLVVFFNNFTTFLRVGSRCIRCCISFGDRTFIAGGTLWRP